MHRRYPGATPFSVQQEEIFFGRDKEIQEFVDLIHIEQTVVLYSKSGLGKSSLINAGLIPKIKTEDALLPFVFRFGAYAHSSKGSPLTIAANQLATSRQNGLLDKIIPQENSLWYHLKKRQVATKEELGYLLIFDQFEELFTYPETLVKQFAQQLAELLYTTIPHRFREIIAAQMQGEHSLTFLSPEEMKALHRPFEVKVLVAIRSDRMSLLNQLTDFLPHILRTCRELQALNAEQAEDAILTPAYLKNEKFISPTFDYSDEAIEKTLNFLTKDNTQNIASFQLQILCESVERKVINQGLKIVEAEHLGDIESLYKNYYDDQLSTIANRDDQLAARVLIEEGLIFEEEERRLTLYEGQIFKDYKISPELLRNLVDCHLLRSEPSSHGDGFNYEISHDSLVAPILKAKAKRMIQEAEHKRREEERKRLEEEKRKLAIEKKKRLRARQIAIFSVLLSVIALTGLIGALIWANQAREARAEAEEASRKAKASEEIAQAALADAKRKSFEVFMEQGNSLLKDGKPQRAREKFAAAYEFAFDESDSVQVSVMVDSTALNEGKSKTFLENMNTAGIALDREQYDLAYAQLVRAGRNCTTAIEEGEYKRLRQKFISEVRQAITKNIEYAYGNKKEINNERFRSYFNKKFRDIENLLQYVSEATIDPEVMMKYEELKREFK